MKWGIVSTVKAPARDILRFVAYHLELGAHRVTIYLDEDRPRARRALRQHPKARVFVTDDMHWSERGLPRPERHQTRQSRNATHAYRRQRDLDWLGHIDVDEFLIAPDGVAEALASLPSDCLSARIRPVERLAGGDGLAYKMIPPRGERRRIVVWDLYPEFGEFLGSGFLSHVAGKIFARSGVEGLQMRIHRTLMAKGEEGPRAHELPQVMLAHVHARAFGQWRKHFDFRHAQGSYRDELAPQRPRESGGMTMHELFQNLVEMRGEAGLRAFYNEVVGDSPGLRERLSRHGLLLTHDLQLDAALRRQFPDVAADGI